MSDLGFPVPRPAFNLLEALAGPVGFTPDKRFGDVVPEPAPAPEPEPEPHPFEPRAEEDAPDPVAEAFSDGFAAGHEQARAEAEARAAEDAAAFEGLTLSFLRLDATLEEELRLRLRDTVAALCEAAIAPLVLDEEALMSRIARAVSMLSRADDERIIRLHPDDIKLLAPRLREDWTIEPEPGLERGTVRIDSQNGGVEDGPATWRLAIAEAMHQC
ncbi:FliH/SctL family protein [Novosphingobium mangrovi (ex Huang et al. 2023)]|uniref:Flagellar assembly protein FliH n=1 Tax=Novosphingobium mangrovi (ex Huang et al. 2023) TaxID=2976432 RepID=A0ABT2I043_9SPHN|nr:FliH/SctL family protein [Novosphingobium mangrovi (ex Huang et al. 2023)]MCT2398171.1 FliH/SctL family protein [Novosphingobium mangrovi (ex Huang et al. 2023)]